VTRFKFQLTLFSLLAHTTLVLALPQNNPVPGGLLVAALPATDISQVTYKGNRVAIIKENQQQYALVGLSLIDKAGKHQLEITTSHNKISKFDFIIHKKNYTIQRLTIKNERKVEPNAKDMIRIQAEQIRMDRARQTWTETPANYDFVQPVTGPVSSIFGLRRIFNGLPRKPHSGLDLAAPEGTPIRAVAAGTVIESGDFFFSGNMVYIDHGQGLISLYAHLHQIQVKTGDKIERGQVIGQVGETGRVTGPHLHLGIILNQTLIDPALMLPAPLATE
jgi:murein DD-endopeptidase MepM/ murein hydrolase activator NlpD